MLRLSNLARATLMASLVLMPAGAAAADPIVAIPDSPDNPNSPDSPTNNSDKDDSGSAGGASGAKPAAGVFPESDGALHMSVQANDPMAAKKGSKPIVPAGS